MQLLLLHPPRNVNTAVFEPTHVPATRPRRHRPSVRGSLLTSVHRSATLPRPDRWRNRVVRLDLDRSQVPAPRSTTLARETAVRARGRGDRSNYQCAPRQRDVPANASVKHSHPITHRLLARGVVHGFGLLALECTSELRRTRTRSVPVAPAYSSDAVARRFPIWERMPGSALLRRYRD